jgi:phospholipase/carboxylesterase
MTAAPMIAKPLSLPHLVRGPGVEELVGVRPPLLVLLHGVGSNEHDLFGLAPYLDQRLVIVSARGPLTHAQSGGAAWYPVTFTEDGIQADESVAGASRDHIERFLGEAVEAYGVDPDRVYLGGFSQGAIMSLYTLLTRPETLAGVLAMSGRLMPTAWTERASDDRLRAKPVAALHGLYDNVLPISEGREIRDHLSTLPIDLLYREYPMGHEVSQESLGDAARWLADRLNAPL